MCWMHEWMSWVLFSLLLIQGLLSNIPLICFVLFLLYACLLTVYTCHIFIISFLVHLYSCYMLSSIPYTFLLVL